MSDFNFRLRFHLPEGYRIQSAEREVELLAIPGGPRIRLRSGQRDQAIEAVARAAVIGGPFASEAEAASAANRARTGLLLWAVRQQVGLDLGGGPPRSVITAYGLELARAQLGVAVRNDFHGIDVYQDEPGLAFASINAQATVGKSLPALRDEFAHFFHSAPALTAKQEVAFDLFCASFFDISNRSRVVTLVAAVEALIQPQPRSVPAQRLVDEMKTLTGAANVHEEDRQAMLSSLEWLRAESIGQAARALINTHLRDREYGGKPAARFLTLCYQIRSDILHRGVVRDRSLDLGTIHGDLRQLVSDLLQAVVHSAAA